MTDSEFNSSIPESREQPVTEQTEATEWPTCIQHPELAAVSVCSICANRFCESCLVYRLAGNMRLAFCPACGGRCDSLAALDAEEESVSFGDLVAGAFTYPFRGDGPYILLAGLVFLIVVQLFSFVPIAGLFLHVIAAGLLSAYILSIVSSSALGEMELPRWADFSDVGEDIVRPLLLLWAVVIVCAGPGYLYDEWLREALQLPSWTQFLVYGLGAIYLPMALASVAVLDRFGALSPTIVVPSIVRVLIPYAMTLVILTAMAALGFLMARYLPAFVPVVGELISTVINVFLVLVAVRIVGVLIFAHRERLNWF